MDRSDGSANCSFLENVSRAQWATPWTTSGHEEDIATRKLPPNVTLSAKCSCLTEYDNRVLSNVNDHVVRISIMTQPYHWHCHPNSDETFLVVEGGLIVEFEHGTLELNPGQMVTVSRGVLHRTRPLSQRSVNLTFEAANAETLLQSAFRS